MKKRMQFFSTSLLLLVLSACSLLPTPVPMPTATAVPPVPPSGYEPQPGDEALQRDQAQVDLTNSKLVTMESFPIQVSAILNGTLSDPCHKLRVVSSVEAERIDLQAYSVFDPATACILMIEPFNATIPLGNFGSGHYSVYVNGKLLGSFDG